MIIVIAVAANGGSGGTGTTTQPTGVPAGNEAPAQQQPAKPASHTVVYKVTGTGKASLITYTTDGMTSTNQESDVKLPWTKTITLPADQPLQIAQVMAQGSSQSSKITVEIEVDGKVVKTAESTGYGIASADANIGTLG